MNDGIIIDLENKLLQTFDVLMALKGMGLHKDVLSELEDHCGCMSIEWKRELGDILANNRVIDLLMVKGHG